MNTNYKFQTQQDIQQELYKTKAELEKLQNEALFLDIKFKDLGKALMVKLGKGYGLDNSISDKQVEEFLHEHLLWVKPQK